MIYKSLGYQTWQNKDLYHSPSLPSKDLHLPHQQRRSGFPPLWRNSTKNSHTHPQAAEQKIGADNWLIGSYFRHKSMWGWGGDKTEVHDGYDCKVYSASGVEVVTKTRVEHLASDEKKKAQGKWSAWLVIFSSNPSVNGLMVHVSCETKQYFANW